MITRRLPLNPDSFEVRGSCGVSIPSNGPLCNCRLFNLGGGTKTDSTSTDSRTGGSDNAVVAHQGAIGEHPLNVTGGTNAAAYQYNTNQQGAAIVGAGQGNNRTVHIESQNVDADVIGSFGHTLRDVLETQSSGLGDVLNRQTEASSGLLSQLGDKISALAESKQTGGDSDRNRIILYVVGGVLLLLGLAVFVFGRKR